MAVLLNKYFEEQPRYETLKEFHARPAVQAAMKCYTDTDSGLNFKSDTKLKDLPRFVVPRSGNRTFHYREAHS
jgi:hypothetical protein